MTTFRVVLVAIVLACGLSLPVRARGAPDAPTLPGQPHQDAHAAVFEITWLEGGECLPPPDPARPALESAAAAWGGVLASPIPIAVSACWTETPACGGLACGGTTQFLFNSPNTPFIDTAYPAALANALAGQDLVPGPEISIAFRAGHSWDFASDPPGNFVTVAEHELGHGLGFTGNLYASYGVGFCGDGLLGPLYPCPTVFDRFVVDSLGVTLLDYKTPDPRILGQKLVSDANFGGPNAFARYLNADPKLYTPAEFVQGSSLSHLDTGFSGTAEALMLPFDPVAGIGPVTRGIFQDLGWKLSDGSPNLSLDGPRTVPPGDPAAFSAAVTWGGYTGQPLTYTWQIDGGETITHTGRGLTDTLTLYWENEGLKTLAVMASGLEQAAGATRAVRVALPERKIYLPAVRR